MAEIIQQVSKRSFYEANGYVVFRNLVPIPLIDKVLDSYKRDIVTSKHPFFRQNTYKYETNILNEFGYVKQSFLDVHEYKKFPKFRDSLLNIFCSHYILDALKEIGGSHLFNLMQGMLFDANTETPPHQEWWYLDTIPNGHLIIAWIALEDINERAGRFYVLPNATDNINFHGDMANQSHSEWLNKIKNYVDVNYDKIVAPDLKKGDVLFLNSMIIHGSLPTLDASFSRKSLTAHYIPSEYKFGNLFKTKNITYKTYKGIKVYRAHPEYSVLNNFMFNTRKSVYNYPFMLKIIRKIFRMEG